MLVKGDTCPSQAQKTTKFSLQYLKTQKSKSRKAYIRLLSAVLRKETTVSIQQSFILFLWSNTMIKGNIHYCFYSKRLSSFAKSDAYITHNAT